MIFVTVGMQLPFDRLMKTVDEWCAATGRGGEVFGQTYRLGRENYVPRHFTHVEELTFDEMSVQLAKANVVVSHAGMGTIISSLMLGKRLVLLPRRAALGEHRNDHQLATVKRLASHSGVVVAMSESDLPSVLDSVASDETDLGGVRPSPLPRKA
jgi:UDP-N-acetylglucosamine transferase subunit ALG13